MEKEKINRINAFLKKHGENPDTISNERMSQLNKIDDAIMAKIAEIKEAQELLKGRPFSIQVIAELSGVSRKTFYNNELLSLYIKEFDVPILNPQKDELKRKKDRCDELERQVHEFLLRDVNSENLRHESQGLRREIEHLHTQLKSLEEQLEKTIQENTRLKQILEKNPVILPFGKKNN